MTSSPKSPGEVLLDLCGQATQELVLAAPFIKTAALERLLEVRKDTASLQIITRWRPVEIAAGVTDLEVFETVEACKGDLLLRQDLHAKWFRGDNLVIIGSANLTGAALGWSPESNLELLVPMGSDTAAIQDFEAVMLAGAVPVDRELYETMVAAAQDWVTTDRLETVDYRVDNHHMSPADLAAWLPVSRNPADLYMVYSKRDPELLPTTTRETGILDLAMLQPPPSLPESAFDSAIAASLLTMPVVREIDTLVMSPQRFGSIRDWLESQLGLTREEANRSWQTLIRWLRHFLPDRYRYERPRHSEIISRRSVPIRAIDPDTVWHRIVSHSGETFHQIRGKPFTYKARGRTIYLHTTNRMISRTAIENALARWPLKRVSDVQDLSAPSYLFAILDDARITSPHDSGR